MNISNFRHLTLPVVFSAAGAFFAARSKIVLIAAQKQLQNKHPMIEASVKAAAGAALGLLALRAGLLFLKSGTTSGKTTSLNIEPLVNLFNQVQSAAKSLLPKKN